MTFSGHHLVLRLRWLLPEGILFSSNPAKAGFDQVIDGFVTYVNRSRYSHQTMGRIYGDSKILYVLSDNFSNYSGYLKAVLLLTL